MFRSFGPAAFVVLLGLAACDAPRLSNPQDAIIAVPPSADYDALSLMARCRNALVLGTPGAELRSSQATPEGAERMMVSLGYGDADNPATYACAFDKGRLVETRITEPAKPSAGLLP